MFGGWLEIVSKPPDHETRPARALWDRRMDAVSKAFEIGNENVGVDETARRTMVSDDVQDSGVGPAFPFWRCDPDAWSIADHFDEVLNGFFSYAGIGHGHLVATDLDDHESGIVPCELTFEAHHRAGPLRDERGLFGEHHALDGVFLQFEAQFLTQCIGHRGAKVDDRRIAGERSEAPERLRWSL
jgi:hypothetical protein